MFQKGTKLHSIAHLKCPRCQDEYAFHTGSWSFKQSFDMRERCPKCNLNYFPEPGYYYGSMFVSYIWTAWFSLIFVALLHWVMDFSQEVAFTALGIFMAINFVWIFRVSRLMWININVKYDAEAIAKWEAKKAVAAVK